MAGAVAQHRRHRREQDRGLVDREPGIRNPEAVDPLDLRIEPQHLAKGVNDADKEDADDQAVQAGIRKKAVPDLLCLTIEDDGEKHGEDQEERHAPEKDLRARELGLIRRRRCRCCHGNPS
jgi:hypothetical protein